MKIYQWGFFSPRPLPPFLCFWQQLLLPSPPASGCPPLPRLKPVATPAVTCVQGENPLWGGGGGAHVTVSWNFLLRLYSHLIASSEETSAEGLSRQFFSANAWLEFLIIGVPGLRDSSVELQGLSCRELAPLVWEPTQGVFAAAPSCPRHTRGVRASPLSGAEARRGLTRQHVPRPIGRSATTRCSRGNPFTTPHTQPRSR